MLQLQKFEKAVVIHGLHSSEILVFEAWLIQKAIFDGLDPAKLPLSFVKSKFNFVNPIWKLLKINNRIWWSD